MIGYADLRGMVGAGAICEVLSVSRSTESYWHNGRHMIPSKYLYILKVRWPELDLNATIMSNGEGHSRWRLRRNMSSLFD